MASNREDHAPPTRSPTVAVLVALALATVAGTPALAQDDETEIDVTWHGDDRGFDANATREISNVWVELCEGTLHKHDDLDTRQYEHREEQPIVGIWVKSGHNSNDEDRPPGAGERFDNADVECPADGEAKCVGPADVGASTMGSSVVVNWTSVANAENYTLYRAEGQGSFEPVLTLGATEFVDHTVEEDLTYRYLVTATIDDVETGACDEAIVTAIPDVGSLLGGALLVVSSVGAYAVYRRGS